MAEPAKIMVIRHAERPKGKYQGVGEAGTPDARALIVRGWQRAGALVALFDPARGPLQNAQLAVPNAIFASDPTRGAEQASTQAGGGSERPVDTILPLAQRLGITPNLSFSKGQERRLVQTILSTAGVVLVCWERDAIPQIAQHIVRSSPPDKPIPDSWPGKRFDVVWVFTPPGLSSARWGFKQVTQRLLCGDKKAPID